jgi:hypothetical protein
MPATRGGGAEDPGERLEQGKNDPVNDLTDAAIPRPPARNQYLSGGSSYSGFALFRLIVVA